MASRPRPPRGSRHLSRLLPRCRRKGRGPPTTLRHQEKRRRKIRRSGAAPAHPARRGRPPDSRLQRRLRRSQLFRQARPLRKRPGALHRPLSPPVESVPGGAQHPRPQVPPKPAPKPAHSPPQRLQKHRITKRTQKMGGMHNTHPGPNIVPDFISTAEGSCLIELGNTRVICTATIEDTVPQFLRNRGKGWVTSENGMLPRSTLTRTPREANKGRQSGRTHEIQRLIGRSLRAVTDLEKLGERTIFLDCDVIQADGGTRTASITGAFIAMGLAMRRMIESGALTVAPIRDYIAATSVGIVDGEIMLDLCYEEDARADVDMNLVITGSKKIVEVQATAEHRPFDDAQLAKMMSLARSGIESLIVRQQAVLTGLHLRQ